MVNRPGFNSQPVWELSKYGGVVVAGERTFKGKAFFELRFWSGERGEKATHKGVTIPIGAVADLAEALTLYASRAGDKGTTRM